MKDPEFKKMMGWRFRDSDGFTYVYGAVKDGSTVAHGRNAEIRRQIRNDKRSIKNKHYRELMKEIQDEC